MKRITKRDIILDVAESLFEKQGYIATGINQITKEADVAAMTLYNNFENKEALILAALERRSKRILETFNTHVNDDLQAPEKRIFMIFDKCDGWVSEKLQNPDDFAGCVFVKASMEFPSASHPAHSFSAAHKKAIVSLFKDDLTELSYSNVDEMALNLHLILEGAIVQANLFSDSQCIKRAKKLAKKLLDASLMRET